MNIKQNKGIQKIKEAWDENPLLVIGVTAGAAAAASRLITAVSEVQGRRAYARQVDNSIRRRNVQAR